MEKNKSSELQMEAVIVISDLSDRRSPCLRARGAETKRVYTCKCMNMYPFEPLHKSKFRSMSSNNYNLQCAMRGQRRIANAQTHQAKGESFWHVLYFKDFSLSSISKSSLSAFTTIDWKSYGLALKRAVDQGNCTVLEWENLPQRVHIDIVLHCYHKQFKVPSFCQRPLPDRNLIKKAVKQALDDLKEKHAGMLLSTRALKIRSYAPDLAKSIAGLILSSNDSEFHGECLSLLRFQSQDVRDDTVEDCIKQKIISVIEMNDRKSEKSKEAAPFLFENDYLTEPNFEDYAVEDEFSSLD